MQTFVTLLQAVTFFTFVWYLYRRFGVLTSISASTYNLVGQQKYLFFGWLAVLAGLNLMQGMGLFGWVASVSLLFTGVTTDFGDGFKPEAILHSVATVVSIGATLVGLLVLYGMWLPIVLFGIGVLLSLTEKNDFIWWLEIAAFTSAIIGYLLR